MSFQNFETFQNQHLSADAVAATGAPAPADTTMTGQADPTSAPYQGPTPGEPSTVQVPQQGGEGKTTLWYVVCGEMMLIVAIGANRVVSLEMDFAGITNISCVSADAD